MNQLAVELDKESYDWLDANYPEICAAVEAEIKAKHSAEDIRRFVVRYTGRIEFAVRCQAAARYLINKES
jgi:hypothetical protein